ncbi:hypothetical protein AYO44_16555 [Planctomycetaceae bacterium SCGC AG-212-F19]|nr:hypothetical protein AYO44_16555 [Planctomycetaceae bacterium SCGC AG-212-F19]
MHNTDAATTLSITQLHLLRSLVRAGWESNALMLTVLLNRCGATEADWRQLIDAGLVEEKGGRIWLTGVGEKEFKRERKGRWF